MNWLAASLLSGLTRAPASALAPPYRSKPAGMSIMGNAITQDVHALWLMLKTEGGWWTVAMLMHHWRPTFEPHGVQQAVDALEAGGFIESLDQAGSRIYGFTPDCEALPDLAPICQPGAVV